MSRVIRWVLLVLMTVAVGCDDKDEAEPNPDLKKPDIPPGRTPADGPGVPPPKAK